MHLSNYAKVKIHKTYVRPILTYAVETRAETSKTKFIMRTAEIKTLPVVITEVTLHDGIRNERTRKLCKV